MTSGDKVPCVRCGAQILPGTAAKTSGMCMPCSRGYRDSLEDSRRRYAEERRRERDPYNAFWSTLTKRVYASAPESANQPSEPERRYFAVRMLVGEVFNGGFEQYFWNSSSSYYMTARKGVIEMGAVVTLGLLGLAKDAIFGANEVPIDVALRRSFLVEARSGESLEHVRELLNRLDREFWSNTEAMDVRLERYVIKHRFLEGNA